jgi:SPP1 family predicted phage head-tail adaptor
MSLRDRVVIQRKVMAPGSTGAPVESWQRLCEPWASVKGVSGRTFLAASAEQAEVTFEVKVRFRADIEAGMRVTHNGQTLEIVAPLPDEHRQWLRLMCKTVNV